MILFYTEITEISNSCKYITWCFKSTEMINSLRFDTNAVSKIERITLQNETF